MQNLHEKAGSVIQVFFIYRKNKKLYIINMKRNLLVCVFFLWVSTSLFGQHPAIHGSGEMLYEKTHIPANFSSY